MHIALPPLLFTVPITIMAGALNLFAFAPFDLWLLQLCSLYLLFYLLLCTHDIFRSMLLAWAFHFGWLSACVHWLYISMHVYGGMPAPLAALAVVLLAAAIALLFAFFAAMAAWLRIRRHLSEQTMLLLVFPAIWMLAEWVRGWLFTGFPWAASGYAHSDGPLAGFAPILGVYGLSWLAGLLAASSLSVSINRRFIMLPIVILSGGFLLKSVAWTAPHGTPISVRLLQGNVPQTLKFDVDYVKQSLQRYHSMIHAEASDLIATPETALPLFLHQLPPDYLPSLAEYARVSNSYIALGIPISDRPASYANSVIGIAPATVDAPISMPYRYDKHHLVPFGEFVPPGFRWFINMMRIPLGDFTRGTDEPLPFSVKDQWILPNICYEDLFGEEIASQLRTSRANGTPEASLLLNVSNIAWFGDSVALPQHLQISRLRSLETGRPMLRATNTGATAIIDQRGTIQSLLPPFTIGTLSASVQGYRGTTPYVRFGNTPIVCAAFAMLFFACLKNARKRTKNTPSPT